MAVPPRWLAAWLLAIASCNRVDEPVSVGKATASQTRLAPVVDTNEPSAAPPPPRLPAATELLTLPNSAYQASLFADDEAIELLTSTAAHRIVAGQKPHETQLDLGFAATVTRHAYVYWSKGALWSAARAASRSSPVRLAPLSEAPQRIVADIAADEFAWLAGSSVVETLQKGRIRRLYSSPGSVDALTLIGSAVYFVERPSGDDFRIGRVELTGGAPTFTELKHGRWPASLSGRRDVIYYEGSERAVVALSLDLKHERKLARDFICSPFVAASRVFCAGVEGIFELPPGAEPRPLVAPSKRVVASLAASSDRLAFVSDSAGPGQDRLALSVVSLVRP